MGDYIHDEKLKTRLEKYRAVSVEVSNVVNAVDLDDYMRAVGGQLSAVSEEQPRRISRTFGQLPTREEFESLWQARDDAGALRGGRYRITLSRSDSEAVERYDLGDGAYTAGELYQALLGVVNDPEPWDLIDCDEDRVTYRSYERHEQAMNLVSFILETLGMEWI